MQATYQNLKYTTVDGQEVTACKITISSQLPVPRQEMWPLLMTSESLMYICRPMLFRMKQHRNQPFN